MLTGSTQGTQGPGDGEQISTYRGHEKGALRAGRIGTAGLLLSVLAATAPLMVVAGVMPTTYAVMGIVGQPLLYVILGVVMALFAVGYAEMSRHVHNAGAFYAYVARGLGGTAGSAASYVAFVAYSALQVGIFGIFGFEVSSLCQEHLDVKVAWWVPALVAVLITAVLGALKIDLNAKVLGVLLIIESLLVVVLDITFASDPGSQGLSFLGLDPGSVAGAGLGTALCFTIAGFLGFEQAPVYAEETNKPRTVVRRVMFMALAIVAVFFALTSWLVGVAAGPDRIVGEAQKESAGLIFSLVEPRLGGVFTDLLHVFFVTGIFASMLAFHNVVSRYAFAMGREGLLPRSLGRASVRTGAPAYGSLLQTVIALVVVLAFAVTDDKPVGDPTAAVLNLFTWMGNLGALGVILLMAVTSVAIIAFFVRRGAAGPQGWRLLCSGIAALGLTTIFVYAVKDFDVLIDAGAGSALSWALPGILLIAALIGAVVGLVLRRRSPETFAGIGQGNEAFQLERAADEEAATVRE